MKIRTRQNIKSDSEQFEKFKTFWPRVWAIFFDFAVFFPLSFMNEWIWRSFNNLSFVLLFWYILNSTVFLIYSIVMHGLYGQTLGKMLLKVKILDISENKLTMGQAFRRDLIPLILFIISLVIDAPKILRGINPKNPMFIKFNVIFFLIIFTGTGWSLAEILTMLTNKKRRALHDYIAGSVVVRTDKASYRKRTLTVGVIIVSCFVVFGGVAIYKAYLERSRNIDRSKTSYNITSFLKQDKNFPFVGFWKKDCKSDSGLVIDKTDDGKYSILLCDTFGCRKSKYMPNTTLIGDQQYRIINENIIEVAVVGDYYWRYYRCWP